MDKLHHSVLLSLRVFWQLQDQLFTLLYGQFQLLNVGRHKRTLQHVNRSNSMSEHIVNRKGCSVCENSQFYNMKQLHLAQYLVFGLRGLRRTAGTMLYLPQALRSGPQLDQGPWSDLNCGFWSQRTAQALLLQRGQRVIKHCASWKHTLWPDKYTQSRMLIPHTHGCGHSRQLLTTDSPLRKSTRSAHAEGITGNCLISSGNV